MIIFVVLYFLFLLAFAVYSAAGIYHLWRFGYIGDLTKPAIFIYVLASLVIIISTLILIATRDWGPAISFF